jgi:hypothetical protein
LVAAALALLPVCFAFAAPPAISPDVGAVPVFDVTPLRISLVWLGVAGVPFYEVERSVDGGAFSYLIRVVELGFDGIANYRDEDVATGHRYAYRVKSCNDDGCGPPGTPFATSFDVIWPIAAEVDRLGNGFHEILHGFNEPVGVNSRVTNRGFHEGVDIGRTTAASDLADLVLAPRGGRISFVGVASDLQLDNGNVGIIVLIGNARSVDDEYDTFNHIANEPNVPVQVGCHVEDGIIPVCVGDAVAPGQPLARMGTRYFSGPSTDHVHAQVEDGNHHTKRHFLSIFTRPEDRDPQGNAPDLHFDENADGKSLLFRNHADPDLSHYLDYEHDTKPLGGDIDIEVEATDEQGTNPREAPIDLSYWLEGPQLPSEDDDDVKSAAAPYKLYDFRTEFFGDSINCDRLYDYQDAANAGCTSRVACSPTAPVCVACPNSEDGIPYQTPCAGVIKDPVSGDVFPYPVFHHFIITHASDTDGAARHVLSTEYWRTTAEDDRVTNPTQANYAGKQIALSANMARFPDGDYTLHVLASDLVHANVEFSYPRIRLENFPPFIRELVVMEDADGNPVTGGVPDLPGCEALVYDYKHPGAPAPYPGPDHLRGSQSLDVVAGADRTLCIRVRFSEQMDSTPARFAVELNPQDGTDALEFHGAFSQTTMPNDTWSGTMIVPSHPDGDWNSSPGTHAKDATVRVYARDLPDRNGAQRLLDNDGDGAPNVFDGNHRIKLDASPPTRSVAIRSEP